MDWFAPVIVTIVAFLWAILAGAADGGDEAIALGGRLIAAGVVTVGVWIVWAVA